MKISKKSAFTLVELLVVVTILSILSAVWFVSYSSYITWVRDTNRKAQLEGMSNGLTMYSANRRLPVPDEAIKIMSGATVLAYQWVLGQDILDTIQYSKEWTDPGDWKYFTYYMTSNKKYYQLLTLLEEKPSTPVALEAISDSFATDYDIRFAYPTGRKLGVLTGAADLDLNKPIQEIAWISNPLDVAALPAWTKYIAHLTYSEKVSTGSLAPILGQLKASGWKYCRTTDAGGVSCEDPTKTVSEN